MPTYEFRCPDGHEFEKFYRKITDAKELPCPVCGKLAMRLVSGGAGLLFKGSGFYLTDYGKNAHRKAGPSTSSDSSKGEGKSGDSKGGEGKGGETGGGSSESKPSESKPAASSTSDASSPKKPSSGTP